MPAKIDIPREELKRLYWKKGMSCSKIGALYNQTSSSIEHKLKSKNIKRRNGNTKELPMIIRNPEFYYLLGTLHGDGSIQKTSFRLQVNDKDFAKKTHDSFCSLGIRPTDIIRTSDNRWLIMFHGKKFIDMLLNSNVPSNKNSKIEYLNGLFDSEASVIWDKYRHKQISFVNTSDKVLKNIKKILTEFRIKFYESKPFKTNKSKKFARHIIIGTQSNVIRFHHHFHFSIKRKQDKLDAIVESYKKGGRFNES